MSELKAAIIGCGTIFPMHALSIKALENVKLVAVSDIIKERAEKKGKEFNVPFYTDFKEMVEKEKPDCVHICLPHYLHAPVSVWCMERGVNVLTEKPMATTLEDGEKMMTAAKENKVLFACILQCRFNDSVVFLKKAIEEGKLGKIRGARCSVNWCRTQSYYDEAPWRAKLYEGGGGVLINQAIHTVDRMCYLVGEKVIRVDSSISNKGRCDIEVEDTMEGVIEFESGLLSSFYLINHYSYDAPVYIELDCENAVASITGDTAVIRYRDNRVETSEESSSIAYEYEGVKSYWGTSHGKQIADYYNALETGAPMLVDAESAFETHKLVCNLYENARKKCLD